MEGEGGRLLMKSAELSSNRPTPAIEEHWYASVLLYSPGFSHLDTASCHLPPLLHGAPLIPQLYFYSAINLGGSHQTFTQVVPARPISQQIGRGAQSLPPEQGGVNWPSACQTQDLSFTEAEP